jgi:flavin-dependent dehydrogenase
MRQPHQGAPREVTVLIAGGGVAGAAAACLLGPRALLIERASAVHDKICGEFVSTEAQGYLRRLGLDLPALGAAPIHSVRLVHRDRMAAARLPFLGYGLTRRALDAALLDLAARRGAQVLRGHAVRGIGAGTLDVAGHGSIPGRAVFLATGKHDVRGVRRQPGRPPEDLVGLKMYLRLAPGQRADLAGHVELLLLSGGYAGLQMVEDGVANLCLLIRRDRFAAAGSAWPGLRDALERDAPHLRRRLAGATTLLDRPLSIFRVPYGYVHQPAPGDLPALFRLGDQAGVIASFTGDGMSIALHTAFSAVAALPEGDAGAYHRNLRRDLSAQIARASLLLRAGRLAPSFAVLAARAWPGALRWIAQLTRVPAAALIET